MVSLKNSILKISLFAFILPCFVNFNLKANTELNVQDLRVQLNNNLKELKPDSSVECISSDEILQQIKSKGISTKLNPGWSVSVSGWFKKQQNAELAEKISLYRNFQAFENNIKKDGFLLYSKTAWNKIVENVEKYLSLGLVSKQERKNPVSEKVKVPSELEILQKKINAQADEILEMFQEDKTLDMHKDTVKFTDFLNKQDSLRSDVAKSIGFFTKIFKRSSFEQELLNKISELKKNVLIHSEQNSGNVTLVSQEKWKDLEQFLDLYLKMKSSKDEKSKLSYAKKILSFPLRTLFGQTVKTNNYGGWALDKCIRLTVICCIVATLSGSYNWLYTDVGFVSGFLMPFKVVKNVSVFGYSVLRFLYYKISSPYAELNWHEEYARQFGEWLLSFAAL